MSGGRGPGAGGHTGTHNDQNSGKNQTYPSIIIASRAVSPLSSGLPP